ncbi:TIGR02444 family protein [Azospirillum brasilense]|uniref:TIGR02444 family protein n=1 Tax=Azospirillum brasilense TaxID=192 RepID=A0A0P0F6R9_AZOBR|nr:MULTISPECIES: TIGR02444 family protein [Azospirillum]ALJ34852.1 hypothetical protein AMK58_05135 [Azospirillum brasilense]MDW7557441.1 TIGR02444 family protein [Azospirillum brasilense]MDW7596879.1 TIGR02444 family protein [Azospirillum brasilense]MDW7631936.1 TIGR02444 family protein [Azospirillum brasilense]MDX5953521.1 TIGR02444 family protein [Azospirillum brasilense]
MSENPLWDFSLAVYGRPGVPAACLDLQDRLGQDVNLLLFAAWAGMACNADLPAEELARIDTAVAPWRDGMVRPLRAIRRRAKGEDDTLYKRLKAAELEAERVQQDRLFALSGLTPAPGGDGAALAAANLYRLVPEGDPAVMALLAALGTPPEP